MIDPLRMGFESDYPTCNWDTICIISKKVPDITWLTAVIFYEIMDHYTSIAVIFIRYSQLCMIDTLRMGFESD